MPLEEHIPQIDNRRFDDIMDEVRTRIARYTPEWTPVWTDTNESDPGITMVQVFAWLSEMLLYRLGRVPQLNYVKFLQLLGIELRAAQPARVDIVFPVQAGTGVDFVIVPERTQVGAESAEGELIVFETERSLIALTAALKAVQVFDGFAFSDVTAVNETGSNGFDPFGPLANPDSALMVGFLYERDFPAQLELKLSVWVREELTDPSTLQCGSSFGPSFPVAELTWEYWDGVDWATMTLLKDETQSLSQVGSLFLKTPEKGRMQRATIGRVDEPLYWLRARLLNSFDETAPRLLAIRTNTASATQARTVADEVLGGSNGSPDQIFRVEGTPVIKGSLRLEVDEGQGFEDWVEVEDFFASGPDDPHFLLNRSTGEVRFGDGRRGRIPVGNVHNPGGNVVAREYRVGGGSLGNVNRGAVSTILNSIDGIDETAITNPRPAFGGADEEALEEAKRRAPQTLKSKCRAVTPEDFERLALEGSNVARAHALPLYHPGFPETPVPGVVSVIIVPQSDEPDPRPSPGTIRSVCAYLNQRRLLTTEVFVLPPTYREIGVSVDLVARDDADLAEVTVQVEDRLKQYFHPLIGGEDAQGWPLGGDIFYSLVYRQILEVDGVERIQQLLISVDGEEMPECRDIEIPAAVLVFSREHNIRASYSLSEVRA